MNERDDVTVRLTNLKYRLEDELKTGKPTWNQATQFLDRLGTPQELPDDLSGAQELLARHSA